MLLFTSLYFSDPADTNLLFLSSLLLLHRSRISAVTQSFFFWWCFPRISLAVSVTAVLKVVIIESMSVSSLLMMVRGANFLPIIAWKVSNTLGSFSFSRSNLSLVHFGLLILFRQRWKLIISKSWSLPMSAPGKLHVLAMFTPDWKHFLTYVINMVVVLSIWAMPGPSSGCFVMTKSVHRQKILKGGKLQKFESSLICVITAEGSTNALPIFTNIPAHFCIPVSLYNKNVLLWCLINDIL